MNRAIIFISFTIFIFFNSYSQQTIKLNIEEEHEVVYSIIEKHFVQKENGERGKTDINKTQYKIRTIEVLPDSSLKICVNITENYQETVEEFWRQRIDHIYKDFRDLNYRAHVNPESFISYTDLYFQIDLHHRKIELLNKPELLEYYAEFLSERNIESTEKSLEILINFYLDKLANHLEFLIWFHNAEITSEGRIKNSLLEDNLVLKNKSPQKFDLSSTSDALAKSGREYKYFSINSENGLLQEYSFLKKDSIQNKYGQNVGEYLFNVIEKNIQLLSSKKVNNIPVIVSGKIINPYSKQLFIRYLDEPFGVNFKKEIVYLDDNGNFHAEVDMKHAGFIFIENQNPNRFKRSASYVLYADKGDKITFTHDLAHPQKPLEISGSQILANEILDELKREFHIFYSSDHFDRLNNAVYDSRSLIHQIQSDGISAPDIFNDLWTEYQKANNKLAEFENNMDYLVFQFIKNELKNYYYGLIFQYLPIAFVHMGKDNFMEQIPEPIQKETDFNNLGSFYNDYGFYSRKCINNYIRYKFLMVSQFNDPASVYRSSLIPDLNQHIQFSRLMVTGSPFYREIAAVLEDAFTGNFKPWKNYDDYIFNTAVGYMKQLKANCFEKAIALKVQKMLDQYEKLQNKNPEIKELNVIDSTGKQTNLNEILASAPTVVLFSSGLRGWMLSLDEFTSRYEDIKFIRVIQGSNKKEWLAYNKIADPKIPTYFYTNDSIALEDIFLSEQVFAFFNRHGELIHYTNERGMAAKLAQQSLEEKKSLDKSQLQLIILLLLILFAGVLITFFIWKWRTRQRLRKEEQTRRLRELELTAIRSQMNPHFLFNSLNSVQNLVQQNKGREAHLYLADFAGLIRKVLQNSEKEEVALAEELEMTRQYLNLEKLRFDFDYSVSVEEGIDTDNTMIPSMLLQPFAENAIIHGLQNKQGPRQLKIEVKRYNEKGTEKNNDAAGNAIVITIEDNGIGRKAAAELSKQKNGKSSRLMKERLEILQQKQNEKYRIETMDLNGKDKGTKVNILLPEEV